MASRYTSFQNIQYFFACLFFASLNFEKFTVLSNISVAKVVGILYICVLLLLPNEVFSVRRIKIPVLSLLMTYFIMVISSIIHNDDIILDSAFLMNIIMFWLLINHQRKDERVFDEGLLWYTIFAFVIAICFLLGVGVSLNDEGRVTVFDENANNLGIKMAVGVLFLLNYCFNHSYEKQIYRPWLLIMIVPMMGLLLATGSRVSILILSSGVVLFVLFRHFKKKGLKVLWLLIGAILLYWGYLFVSRQELLMARMERTVEEGHISQRDYIWGKYIELIEQHPILGVGFSGADQYALEVFHQARSPHNVLIEVALYSGLVGEMLFLPFLISVFFNALQNNKKRKKIGPLITSMAIVGMVLSAQAFHIKLFWVLAAYAISYKVIPKNALVSEDYIIRSN